ncbi:MAG: hypothetical protein SO133_06275, partial [Alloprevotella sp.]|nr:hypothetical protein [Alloprevotella sp.]
GPWALAFFEGETEISAWGMNKGRCIARNWASTRGQGAKRAITTRGGQRLVKLAVLLVFIIEP